MSRVARAGAKPALLQTHCGQTLLNYLVYITVVASRRRWSSPADTTWRTAETLTNCEQASHEVYPMCYVLSVPLRPLREAPKT
eukprot:736571-Prorocentrum_minimum.AAC.1